MSEKPKCQLCEKTLKSFTATTDWNKRKYHKACYRKTKKEDTIEWLKRMDIIYGTNMSGN